ncbi:MAG TPA: asparagine synthase-related protein, partial [Pyrinomonadaceae bacterium]|nr:asparagine synthase-related protein [Pyrinomonadaceae bacterium]
HEDLAGHVACGPADRLDERLVGPQEALLVRVEDRHQRDFAGKIFMSANTITANARIDGREELIAKLHGKLTLKSSPSDAELILNAYEAWGEDCVKHLIGDFAFAIWDNRLQRFFCARDHFGVKPFFFTHIGDSFKFSSTLNELRLDPGVSDALNEVAIGDYLLFGLNQDLSTTTFKDIQRLPPGHSLTVTKESIKMRRYWSPGGSSEVRFRDPHSYVERFSELLSRAVQDRLRTDRVSVSMSGGLDSTSVAAIACNQADLQACTVVYDHLIPDQERHYSTAAAQHLGIPINYVVADRYSLFDEQVPGDMDQPEPFLISPFTGQFNDLLRLCAAFGPVALTGYDGDAFMSEPQPSRFKIRSRLKRLLGKRTPDAVLPEWIDESFAKRTNLQERLKQSSIHPASPANPIWTALFEGYDPGATKLPLEVRHPFIDVRLVEYLLPISIVPWRVNKHILRLAMKDRLPATLINRPKTPLAGDPALQLARHASVRWLDSFEVNPQLRNFVDLNLRRPLADEQTSDGLWASLRVFALNYWLTNSQPSARRTTENQIDKSRAYQTAIA